MRRRGEVDAMICGVFGLLLALWSCAARVGGGSAVDDATHRDEETARLVRGGPKRRVAVEPRLVTPAHVAGAIWRVWLPMVLREGTGVERAALLLVALEVWQGTAWDREAVRELVRPHREVLGKARARIAQDVRLAGTRRRCRGGEVCRVVSARVVRAEFLRSAPAATARYARGVVISGTVGAVRWHGVHGVVELAGGRRWRPVQLELLRGDAREREAVDALRRGDEVAMFCGELAASVGVIGRRCSLITPAVRDSAARAWLAERYRAILAGHGVRLSESGLAILADRAAVLLLGGK